MFTFFFVFWMKLKVNNFESAVKDLMAGSVCFGGFLSGIISYSLSSKILSSSHINLLGKFLFLFMLFWITCWGEFKDEEFEWTSFFWIMIYFLSWGNYLVDWMRDWSAWKVCWLSYWVESSFFIYSLVIMTGLSTMHSLENICDSFFCMEF